MDQPPSSEPPFAGGGSRVREFARASFLYLEARGRLFQIEAQEAGFHAGRVVVLGVVAFGLLAGAWLLVVPAAVMVIAEKTSRDWREIAFFLALAHFAIGIVLALRARAVFKRLRLFEESINQFQRDREWVHAQDKR